MKLTNVKPYVVKTDPPNLGGFLWFFLKLETDEGIEGWGECGQYGPGEPHCYVGEIPEGQSLEMFYMPIFAEHMKMMAPDGADTSSWCP